MKLPPTLTIEESSSALRALPADGSGGVVDASDLRQFDTSALALLLQARRLAQAGGHEFRVNAAPPKLAQLARLYGVAELLGLDGAGAQGVPA
jgi:phospholipid transport system transporter-binding protein